jgi:AcrR family transcriptional regulator
MPRTGLTSIEITEKAIDIAEILIRKYGFEKIRLVDIAKELQVSHVALYKHFPDKSALLDGVSERWLDRIDLVLGEITEKKKPVKDLIFEWFMALHKMKREKVLNDPELYKAFDMGAEGRKPFVIKHLGETNKQLTFLVKRGLTEKVFKELPPEKIVRFLFEATISFHHPKLVLARVNDNREKELIFTLELLLKSLI